MSTWANTDFVTRTKIHAMFLIVIKIHIGLTRVMDIAEVMKVNAGNQIALIQSMKMGVVLNTKINVKS